jgi:hypothetical protein
LRSLRSLRLGDEKTARTHSQSRAHHQPYGRRSRSRRNAPSRRHSRPSTSSGQAGLCPGGNPRCASMLDSPARRLRGNDGEWAPRMPAPATGLECSTETRPFECVLSFRHLTSSRQAGYARAGIQRRGTLWIPAFAHCCPGKPAHEKSPGWRALNSCCCSRRRWYWAASTLGRWNKVDRSSASKSHRLFLTPWACLYSVSSK